MEVAMKRQLSIILMCLSIITLIGLNSSCKKANVENLLARGKAEDAADNCEDLEGTARNECYLKVARFHFQQEQFKKAAKYYALAGAHDRVINSYLLAKSRPDAEAYCNSQAGGAQKQCAVLLARSSYLGGDYDKAIFYFTLAGEMGRVKNVQAKIPAFRMVESLAKQERLVKEPAIRKPMADARETLKEYIYMDRYRQWMLNTGKETDKKAEDAYKKAWGIIDDIAAPAFTKKLRTLMDGGNWSAAAVNTLSFDHARMRGLMTTIKSLDRMAYVRRFFTKYSVVFREGDASKAGKPGKDYNYEEAYGKALQHTDTLFKTLLEFAAEKQPGKELLSDYKNDLEVDVEVIDYIAGMLVNLQTRIVEIDRRGKRIRKIDGSESLKHKTEAILWDFVAVGNQVMSLLGKGKYPEASQLMLSGYNSAKEAVTGIEKSLDIAKK
jgi:tetratricopeptide (TPR) repeat protein